MSTRKSRIPADKLGFLIFAAVMVAVLGAVAFSVSFPALSAWAPAAAIPHGTDGGLDLSWAIPVAFDGTILAYTAAAMVQRQRRESQAFSWTVLGVLTAVSVAANAGHAVMHGTGTTTLEQIGGPVIAGLIPLMQFAATHTLSSLIVEPVEVVDPVSHALEAAEEGRRLPRAERDAVIRRLGSEGRSVRDIAAAVPGVSKSTAARVLSTKG